MAASHQSVESVRAIALNAIERINRLASLIEERAPARSGNVMEVASRLSGTGTNSAWSERSSTSQAVVTDGQSNQGSNALEELRRRFPTTSRERGASRRYKRSTSRPYPVRRPAGRPLPSEDVIIVERGREKSPRKCEKPDLERSGRVISGFNVNRRWDAKQLNRELSTLRTGEMEGMLFEIVKNAGGTLLSLNLPQGKEIDAKLLLKSVARSGYLYLRMLEELPSMNVPSDRELERSAFDFGERKIEPVSPTDPNSRGDLRIDLTQPTLSSSSFGDHGFNASGNSQAQTSP